MDPILVEMIVIAGVLFFAGVLVAWWHERHD
jgi:hypothetical protein